MWVHKESSSCIVDCAGAQKYGYGTKACPEMISTRQSTKTVMRRPCLMHCCCDGPFGAVLWRRLINTHRKIIFQVQDLEKSAHMLTPTPTSLAVRPQRKGNWQGCQRKSNDDHDGRLRTENPCILALRPSWFTAEPISDAKHSCHPKIVIVLDSSPVWPVNTSNTVHT